MMSKLHKMYFLLIVVCAFCLGAIVGLIKAPVWVVETKDECNTNYPVNNAVAGLKCVYNCDEYQVMVDSLGERSYKTSLGGW